ncbi:hypothetical protein ABZZ36_38220, partial [Actinacidiphila glaucinigra]|uniref:hypothetical protein n=1 Tax=Actinacidiphila glaucinigra TaxID=235986 RepID=UPI0033BBC5C4
MRTPLAFPLGLRLGPFAVQALTPAAAGRARCSGHRARSVLVVVVVRVDVGAAGRAEPRLCLPAEFFSLPAGLFGSLPDGT